MKESDLQIIIKAYKDDKLGDKEMIPVFYKLAELVYKSPCYHFQYPNPESILKDAANVCLEKMQRYDPAKGKAFNYFTTIIGCFIRQITRTHRNLEKLRKINLKEVK